MPKNKLSGAYYGIRGSIIQSGCTAVLFIWDGKNYIRHLGETLPHEFMLELQRSMIIYAQNGGTLRSRSGAGIDLWEHFVDDLVAATIPIPVAKPETPMMEGDLLI